MNKWQNIRQIIEMHYPRQQSRYLVGGRKMSTDREYYYDSSEYKTAYNLADLISHGLFEVYSDLDHISFNLYPDKKLVKTKCPCMLRLRESSTFYELDFYAITGYEAIKSYGDRTALRLTFLDKPIFQLLLSKTTGELLLKNSFNRLSPFRFSWWINRLLRENTPFRHLMVDILEEVGKEKYIFRDIARCIRKDHYCLIPAPIHEIEKYYTPEKLIHGLTQSRLFVNFNKKDLNYSYYIAVISEQINERDHGLLLSIKEETILEWISPGDLYHGPQISNFLSNYYRHKLDDSYETTDDLNVYTTLCTDHGIPFSLRISSLSRLRAKVQEIMLQASLNNDKAQENLIPPNSCFRALKTGLPPEFEWITSRERLYLEGVSQKNCVYTYMYRIRTDHSAIIHWDHESPTHKLQHYTIEVKATADGRFFIAQMKGFANAEPFCEDYVTASDVISAINTNDSEDVSEDELDKMVADLSAFLQLPIEIN